MYIYIFSTSERKLDAVLLIDINIRRNFFVESSSGSVLLLLHRIILYCSLFKHFGSNNNNLKHWISGAYLRHSKSILRVEKRMLHPTKRSRQKFSWPLPCPMPPWKRKWGYHRRTRYRLRDWFPTHVTVCDS